MTRRESIAALLGSAVGGAAAASERTQQTLQKMFGAAQGVALLLDVKARRLIATHRLDAAAKLVVPPGSTLKPLSLAALLEAGKLRAGETHACSGKLMLAGRSFACVHPRSSTPIDLPLALAYSCNEYVANMAKRFAPGELAVALNRAGLSSRTRLAGDLAEAAGSIHPAQSPEASQLQALGEDRIQVTPLELAIAYQGLAAKLKDPKLSPILEGMEAAVEIGTAQRAAVPGLRVAGKTGSSLQPSASGGTRWAWFAGIAPSRDPRVVVVVLTQGAAGGADSAPIASKILRAHFGGEL